MTKPLILISNDDSIFSKGIKALVDVASKYGEVVVVAPDSPQSAKSHAITLENPISYKREDLFRSDIEAFACSGSPADCVKIAINQVLNRKPDLILSGINHGANTSVNILYSGTVAAALEGAIHKIPSIALSITSHDAEVDLEASKIYADQIIGKILQADNKEVCLNVNIPDIKQEEIKGMKICKQTIGAWFEEFFPIVHPHKINPIFWLTGKYVNFEPERTDTDIWAIENNYVAVVPIKIDLTDYEMIEELKKYIN